MNCGISLHHIHYQYSGGLFEGVVEIPVVTTHCECWNIYEKYQLSMFIMKVGIYIGNSRYQYLSRMSAYITVTPVINSHYEQSNLDEKYSLLIGIMDT